MIRLLCIIVALIFASHIAYAGVSDVQKAAYADGKAAWLIQERSVPILSARIAFSGVGAASIPPEKRGLAVLAMRMLNEGAGNLDSAAFQAALDYDAISMSARAGQDNVIISLETLSEHADRAFQLLGLALAKPRLDEDAFVRVKAKMLTELTLLEQRADYMASRHFAAHAWATHPYHADLRGTKTSLQEITISDVRDYIAHALTLHNMHIAVVGDSSAKALSAMLRKHLGALPERAAVGLRHLKEAAWQGGGAQHHYHHPNAQTEIQFGWEGVKRDHPDFYTAYILNHMLGGSGLTSKLSLAIRGEGLAYAVGSGLASYDKGAMLKGSFATRHEQTEKGIALLKKAVSTIAQKGFTEEELATAKRYITGAFPLQLASNQSLVQYLLTMRLDGLGEDYLKRRNDYMSAVTLDDVNRLARDVLSDDKLLIVTTGSE